MKVSYTSKFGWMSTAYLDDEVLARGHIDGKTRYKGSDKHSGCALTLVLKEESPNEFGWFEVD